MLEGNDLKGVLKSNRKTTTGSSQQSFLLNLLMAIPKNNNAYSLPGLSILTVKPKTMSAVLCFQT